jgi:hypothetical protein
MSSDISDREKSNKDYTNKDKRNPRFGNVSNRGKSNINQGLRFSDTNTRGKRNKDKGSLRFADLSDSSSPNNSVLKDGASKVRVKPKTRSLKENRIERMENIDGRRTRGLKRLPALRWSGYVTTAPYTYHELPSCLV